MTLKPDPKPHTRGTLPGQCNPTDGHYNNRWAIIEFLENGDRVACCVYCHETVTFKKGQLETDLETQENRGHYHEPQP